VSQREVLSVGRIAAGRRGMTTRPATAQRTVSREETAAPTTNLSAKVYINRHFFDKQNVEV